MACLIDTNVLLRVADQGSPECHIAQTAIERLLAEDEQVYIATQVLVEFWVVATRPEAVNGLGWLPETAVPVVLALQDQFPVLDETPEVRDCWIELVERCEVVGKRAHDARLASLAKAYGVERLLTFNTADFPRSWGVEAIHPNASATPV